MNFHVPFCLIAAIALMSSPIVQAKDKTQPTTAPASFDQPDNVTTNAKPVLHYSYNYNTAHPSDGQVFAMVGNCSRGPVNTNEGFYCQLNWLVDSSWGHSPLAAAGNFIAERPPGVLRLRTHSLR